MMYLVTRNRRGQPPTTDMDEFVDGKPTEKIVVGSRIIDDKYIPIYKGEEPFEPDPERFNRWFQKYYGDYNQKVTERGTFAENLGKPEGEEYEVHVLEFDWAYGHRKEDCSSKKDALKRKEQWQDTFSEFEFSDFKIFKEMRYRTPIN